MVGYLKFADETSDTVASLYPTAEEARITCAIVDAAAKVRNLDFKYLAEGKGATVIARFGPDGITFVGQTARVKGRTRCCRRFTSGRGGLLVAPPPSTHDQELVPSRNTVGMERISRVTRSRFKACLAH
ncbi:hypothetical protein LBMAG56_24350 [Verrucomicrobiota bacterium]|nr:hypothetical protein LBMAG56_24350 [Verrucomicrobiota bacterium]